MTSTNIEQSHDDAIMTISESNSHCENAQLHYCRAESANQSRCCFEFSALFDDYDQRLDEVFTEAMSGTTELQKSFSVLQKNLHLKETFPVLFSHTGSVHIRELQRVTSTYGKVSRYSIQQKESISNHIMRFVQKCNEIASHQQSLLAAVDVQIRSTLIVAVSPCDGALEHFARPGISQASREGFDLENQAMHSRTPSCQEEIDPVPFTAGDEIQNGDEVLFQFLYESSSNNDRRIFSEPMKKEKRMKAQKGKRIDLLDTTDNNAQVYKERNKRKSKISKQVKSQSTRRKKKAYKYRNKGEARIGEAKRTKSHGSFESNRPNAEHDLIKQKDLLTFALGGREDFLQKDLVCSPRHHPNRRSESCREDDNKDDPPKTIFNRSRTY